MATLLATTNGLNDRSKRSFEFRMCKKVAELTQVVHMLFTRNHEKEMAMEALKEAYELEMCEVIADAKSKMAAMQKQQEDMLRERSSDTDRIRKLIEGDYSSKEQEWRKKLEDSEKHLQEERTQCQNLRDMLMSAQVDIENLRQGVSEQLNSQTNEIAKRDREIERLKKEMSRLERTLKTQSEESNEAVQSLEQSRDGAEKELRHVQGMLEESHRTRDQLLMRNKQLEAEMKGLRKDFHRRVADMVQKGLKNGSTIAQNEELERLRREIQRYRLELSNRDANFNRMFTDKQPIHLDRTSSSSAGGGGLAALKLQTSHSAGTVHPSLNGPSASNPHPGILKREVTRTGPPSGPVICFQEPEAAAILPNDRQRVMSTPTTKLDQARDSRLPSICSSPDLKPRPQDSKPRPQDSKPRPQDSNKPHPYESKTPRASSGGKFFKPRPLPKEMLFSK